MSKLDHLGLSGQTLKTFLTVLEETSVSRAAEQLGVSQSAVSHTLDKLRKVFNDPLFVRIGRQIEPTARAIELGPAVESVLVAIGSLVERRHFDPLVEEMEFTVAANDFPVQLIFPKLLKELSNEGAKIRVRFIPAGIPSASTLSASRYRLLITPTPPNDPNLETACLVESKMAIFYDSKIRKPPRTSDQYAASEHIEVEFSNTESSIMALPLAHASKLISPIVTVPNFGSLAHMISGTDRITTQLDVMKLGLLSDLDVSPLPFKTKPVELLLMWHRRENDDPAHQWFRQRIIETMNSILRK